MNNVTVGQRVAFSQVVLRRAEDPRTASARGRIVELHDNNRIAAVDWEGTWFPNEETGSTVRWMPVKNLTPVLSNGAVFGD